ncbi:MAG: hypothetical protein NC218_02135 [Acetobacter sp.]|nr:hypothetical protein [Acetobacter sp.]
MASTMQPTPRHKQHYKLLCMKCDELNIKWSRAGGPITDLDYRKEIERLQGLVQRKMGKDVITSLKDLSVDALMYLERGRADQLQTPYDPEKEAGPPTTAQLQTYNYFAGICKQEGLVPPAEPKAEGTRAAYRKVIWEMAKMVNGGEGDYPEKHTVEEIVPPMSLEGDPALR